MRFFKPRFMLATALLSVFVPVFAWAGNEKGNGGNAVVCYADAGRTSVVSVEMFDYWEMERSRPIPGGIQLGASTLTVRQKIDFALDRMRVVDPTRAASYRAGAHEILDHLDEFLSDAVNPTPIEDDHPEATPVEPCTKVQFAVQLVLPEPGKRRFQINRALWNAPETTNDARAGLILHEVIYREALRLGHKNSDGVRRVNYALSTALLSQIEAETPYRALLEETRFPLGDACVLKFAKNLNRTLPVVNGSDQGYGDSFLSCPFRRVRMGKLEVRFTESAILDMAGGNLNSIYAPKMEFELETSVATFRRLPETLPWNGGTATTIYFDSKGNVSYLEGWTFETRRPALVINGESFACGPGRDGKLEFKDDEIRGCVIGRQVTVRSNDGTSSIRIDGSKLTRVDGEGKLSDAVLGAGQTFRLKGVSVPVALVRARFEPSGHVVSGVLAAPLEQVHLGRTLAVHRIRHDGSEWRGEGVSDMQRGLIYHQGKMILDRLGNQNSPVMLRRWEALTREHCRGLGFDGTHGTATSHVLDATEIYVGPYTELYDSSEDKWERVFDQKVKVLRANFRCAIDVPVSF